MTHAYAHFSNERVIAKLRIVSCPGGGVWVAVTREFERDNCVTSEILQSDWTIPNRAGVPRKSTKVPRPSFVRESREGLGPRLLYVSLGPRPSRDSRTKEGLGTFSRFSWHSSSIWDGPIRLEDFACHAIVTFKLTCDGYPNPAPWHDTMRSFAITRSLLKCACA